MMPSINLIGTAAVVMLALISPSSAAGNLGSAGAGLLSRDTRAVQFDLVKNDKSKWKNGGCKYQYKSNRRGYKESCKCK